MAKKLILSCKTLKNELEKVLRVHNLNYKIIYGDSRLHKSPDMIRNFVQRAINHFTNYDYILINYGICGRGLFDIKSGGQTLVFTKLHDCVAIMLGSNERYLKKIMAKEKSMFFTRGWLDYISPRINFYESHVPRVGEELARKAAVRIIDSYDNFMLIDTGAYDLEKAKKEVEEEANFFNKKTKLIQGDLSVIEKLVLGQWDEDFELVGPFEKRDALF